MIVQKLDFKYLYGLVKFANIVFSILPGKMMVGPGIEIGLIV